MSGLPDILRPGLGVIFCGTAAGETSAARGHYYAGPGNKFWPTLALIGLTPRRLLPDQDHEALAHGFGFTDLVKDFAGMDRVIPRAARGAGARERLWAKTYRPVRIAFNGKKSASVALDQKKVSLGRQAATHPLGPEVWVLPSTSGAASGYWDLKPWQMLAEDLRRDAASTAYG